MTHPTPHPKHLVLLGAGPAHLQVLSNFARQAVPGVQVTLVDPSSRQLHSTMLPGFVAGHHDLSDCTIALEPLLKNTDIHWRARQATGLDVNARTLTLDDGSTHSFDYLSINLEAVQNRHQIEQAMPGAREYGLFARPVAVFGALWPRVTELAQTRPLRVAVIGGEAASIELAMAIRFRLPTCAVTLITGGLPLASHDAPPLQQRLMKALKRRNITVLADLAVGIQQEQVMLASGARLACDLPVIATAAQAPDWLRDSGLALDEHSFIAVDACQRSSSHAHVFAIGEVSARLDQPLAHDSAYAAGAASLLASNLAAVVAGLAPQPDTPLKNSVHFLSGGDRQDDIASWGRFSAQGRWAGWLKDWVDRAFIKRYRRA
ncbi:MAG: FAD-dependent oxidoreductase [Pseudomonadota bacterium]